VHLARTGVFGALLFGRMYRRLLAWLGWVIALVLLVQRWRMRRSGAKSQGRG
jgi:hypothetical protein